MVRYLVLAGLLMAGPAMASDWTFVGVSGINPYYVDASSIVYPASSNTITPTKVWVKVDFSRDKTTPVRTAVNRWEFSCSTHQVRVTSVVQYDATGDVMRSYSTPFASFEDIVPDSVGQNIEAKVCPKVG